MDGLGHLQIWRVKKHPLTLSSPPSLPPPANPSPFYVQNLNKAVDAAYPLLAKVCKEATIDCHLADTRDINPPLVRREGGREGREGREE
jgi:hypothetical protein